ncbi:MAG: Na+/H+ antiporter subunit E [Rickettsiales endosymbiont of Dermacentor nuttalli]
MRKILLLICLSLCWYVFSGRHDLLFLTLGIISITTIYVFISQMKLYNTKIMPIKLNLKLFLYIIWLFKEIILSSYLVTKIVWTKKPSKHIKPTTIWLSFSNLNEITSSIYAHSITLTPGTVCLNITEDKIKVHLLNEKDLPELLQNKMIKSIMEL